MINIFINYNMLLSRGSMYTDLSRYLELSRVDDVSAIVSLLKDVSKFEKKNFGNFSDLSKRIERSIIATEEFLRVASSPSLYGTSLSKKRNLEEVIRFLGAKGVKWVLMNCLLRRICNVEVMEEGSVIFSPSYTIKHSLFASRVCSENNDSNIYNGIDIKGAVLLKEIGAFCVVNYYVSTEGSKVGLVEILKDPSFPYKRLSYLYCMNVGLGEIGSIIEEAWVNGEDGYKFLRDAEKIANYLFPLPWLTETKVGEFGQLVKDYGVFSLVCDIEVDGGGE